MFKLLYNGEKRIIRNIKTIKHAVVAQLGRASDL